MRIKSASGTSNPLDRSMGTEFGYRLEIFRPNLLARENQMDRPPSRRLPGLHQHIDSRHVLELEIEQLSRLRDLRQILAPHDDIDIFGQASSVRLRFFNV